MSDSFGEALGKYFGDEMVRRSEDRWRLVLQVGVGKEKAEAVAGNSEFGPLEPKVPKES